MYKYGLHIIVFTETYRYYPDNIWNAIIQFLCLYRRKQRSQTAQGHHCSPICTHKIDSIDDTYMHFQVFFGVYGCMSIPYSRKYWREINLADWRIGGLRADRQIKIRQFLFSRNNVTYRNAKNAKLKSANFDFRAIRQI